MSILGASGLCPVCGFDFFGRFGVKPWNENIASEEICPSCGIHFGYDDVAGGNMEKRLQIYIDWRKKWIENGMKWFSRGMKQPKDWNPKEQLKSLENLPE